MATFKKITKQAISGDRGVAFIHSVCSKIGFAFHPTNQSIEAGIDGFIEIRDTETERATNCILQVQSKAESGKFTAETDSGFEFLCEEKDIDHWMSGNTPIILVASRPMTNEGYWIDIREWFSDPTRRRERRIQFSKTANRFDESCKAALANLAVPKDAGFYFAPIPKRESLLSNLLPVSSISSHIYRAETTHKRPGDIWQWARENEMQLPSEWYISGEQLISIHNLRDDPWPMVCERGTVEQDDVSEWSLSDDSDRQRQFVRLLNQCLKAKLRPHGVRFHPLTKRYYFLPPQFSLKTRTYPYRSLLKHTSREVFRAYTNKKDASRVAYYRHAAFEGHFFRFDDEWFLEVTPTYFYTYDGKNMSQFDGDLLKGVKRLEKNLAVLGQVVMWAELLTKPADLYMNDYPHLRFDPQLTFDFPYGVDDSDWRNRESEASKESLEGEAEFGGLFE
jgi:hypothetical protein